MKLTTISSIFFLCLFALHASGQNRDSIAIRRYYEENSILWLGQSKYEKNNQIYPVQNLKNEFTAYRDASAEFKKYQKTNRGVGAAIITSTLLLTTSFIVKDRNVKIACAAGSVVAISVAIPLGYKSIKQLTRSIWYYNRDILLQ